MRRDQVQRWLIPCAIAGAISLPIVWHKQIRFRLFPRNIGTVVPGKIYRGADQHLLVFRDLFNEHKIRTVVDLSGPDPEEEALCVELGIERFEFELRGDGTGDPKAWAQVVSILADESRQPIFVHCAAGAQRTSTAVLLYRHVVEGAEFKESYPESFRYGHKDDEWQLLAFLADNYDEILMHLRELKKTADGHGSLEGPDTPPDSESRPPRIPEER